MHYTLRLASNSQINLEMRRVQEFFAKNAHRQVRERAPDVLKDAIDRASLLLLEDSNGHIQGTCAQIHHNGQAFSETGAARVLVNGFGLQSIMMGICALNEYLFAPPKEFIFAITGEDNLPSLKSIPRAGFVLARPTNTFLTSIGYGDNFPDSKRFFRFSDSHSSPVIGTLLDLASSKRVRKGDKSIDVKVEHPLFRPENLELLRLLETKASK